jgi:pimeloyl-ACP methyl ester carboxylesterase
MQRLRASLTTLDRMTAGDREFLLLDPDGDGRVVEVLGEIDHAKRVVIYVPGFGTTLADYADGTPKAQALAEALAAGSGDSAVIDFLGYDAPDWSPDEILGVAGEQRAAEGAAALADLVASLRSRGVPRDQIVVVGHSYGSVVGGLALSEFDLDVAKFVALGSPGLGTGIARRSDLGRPEVEIVAVAATGDVVRHAPGHGADPADPGFGAETFPTGNSTGHSGYLSGDALRALVAEIAAPS